MPESVTVEGVRTQGEQPDGRYVTEFCIEYTTDGTTYYDVVDGNNDIVVSGQI